MAPAMAAALAFSSNLWEQDRGKGKASLKFAGYSLCLCVCACVYVCVCVCVRLAALSMLIDSSVARSITPNRAVTPSPPL